MNNLRTPPPKFLQKPSPYFFMVHLLHRLYGVDAPDATMPVPEWVTENVVTLACIGLSAGDRRQSIAVLAMADSFFACLDHP